MQGSNTSSQRNYWWNGMRIKNNINTISSEVMNWSLKIPPLESQQQVVAKEDTGESEHCIWLIGEHILESLKQVMFRPSVKQRDNT